MKIPLSWLQEYIALDIPTLQIAKILTMAGLEVDNIENIEDGTHKDILFDISLTPNLGHCASLIGIARELSTATETPYSLPSIQVQENPFDPIEKAISANILDPTACPRYACRLIKNVEVKASPEWYKKNWKLAAFVL